MSRARGKRRLSPCSCGACHRCQISVGLTRAWADGRRTFTPHVTDWLPDEDALLAQLIGEYPLEEVAERLYARFLTRRRTARAVQARALRLGYSTAPRGLTLSQVRRLFGVRYETVARWVDEGLLRAERGRGKDSVSRCRPEAIEAFVRASPWAYDRERLPPGRYRALAEVQDRYLSPKEVARALGMALTTLKGWMYRGVVPYREQHGNGLRIRAKDVPALPFAIAQARSQAAQQRRLSLAEWNGQRRTAAPLRRVS